jgi:hypothetical protein
MLANTEFLRNLVVGDARFRKLGTYSYVALIAVDGRLDTLGCRRKWSDYSCG